MKEIRIEQNNGKEVFKVLSTGEIEFVNPIEFYSTYFASSRLSIERDYFKLKSPHINNEDLNDFLISRIQKKWEEEYKRTSQTEVPPNLINLLKADKKSRQVKLLNGLKLTTDEFFSFIYKAWLDYGFSFSQYKSEHLSKGIENGSLPQIIYIDGNGVNKVGSTSLSDGQLKQVVAHRKVMIAKLIDKGENWHCFFLTYESLKGNESWQGGQPHFHYISNKFGLSRKEVITSLKSKEYKLGNLPHIALTDYGTQP